MSSRCSKIVGLPYYIYVYVIAVKYYIASLSSSLCMRLNNSSSSKLSVMFTPPIGKGILCSLDGDSFFTEVETGL
jgi:hypothetical protein